MLDTTTYTSPAEAITVRDMCIVVSREFSLRINVLDIARGQCVAIVGHNGSGKSCLLEALAGLRPVTAALMSVLGGETQRFTREPELRRGFGAQLQRNSYPPDFAVSQLVALHRRLFGEVDPMVAPALGLGELSRKDYGDLSRGQRQRVDLYMALAHCPELALLDEPTSGLDAQHSRGFRQLLAAKSATTTIVMASHSASELAHADRVIWLAHGTMVAAGEVKQVMRDAIGSFTADLVYGSAEAADAAALELSRRGLSRPMRRPDAFSLQIFSDAPLEPMLTDLISAAERYAFGPAGLDAFLDVVAEGPR